MKVSEKSLELNVGAELLNHLRLNWGLTKAYLRGLTQREEKSEGVDFFVQLSPKTKLFAFQFKAPKGSKEHAPYKYTVVDYQHDKLYQLAGLCPGAVFYVLPLRWLQETSGERSATDGRHGATRRWEDAAVLDLLVV